MFDSEVTILGMFDYNGFSAKTIFYWKQIQTCFTSDGLTVKTYDSIPS